MLYRVKTEDSLTKIAMRELGDINKWKAIAKLNRLSPPYIIHPNELLLLPEEKPMTIMIDRAAPVEKKKNTGLWIVGGIAALLALMG